MQIRDAEPADADRIARVARDSWHAAYDSLLGEATVDAVVDEWYDPASLREAIREAAAPSATFLVVETSSILGFAHAGPARGDESDPAADAFLTRLYVHPGAWGEGVGTALTARLAAALAAHNYERVWLEVFAANKRARRFYESLGLEQVGTVTETVGGTEVETVHLAGDVSELVNSTREPS